VVHIHIYIGIYTCIHIHGGGGTCGLGIMGRGSKIEISHTSVWYLTEAIQWAIQWVLSLDLMRAIQ
jgi:hypothetical protein